MKLIKIILVSLPLYLLSSFSSNSTSSFEPILIREEIIFPPSVVDNKSHSNFLEAIGHRESGNRYDIVNPYGYMGRYQFGKSTLRTLGYRVTRNEFLSNPLLQEEAMHSLLTHNQYILRNYITTYEGKNLWGVRVTKSGLLASAHLAGAGNVIRFLNRGLDFSDKNGTKMTSYMRQFGGYRLNI